MADMVVEYGQTEMDITMCVTEGGGGGGGGGDISSISLPKCIGNSRQPRHKMYYCLYSN